MWRWYTLLSFRPEAEIAALKREVDAGRNPKDAKVMLAKEITARFHSARRPMRPSRTSATAAAGGVPDEIPEVALSGAPLAIGALLKQAGWRPPPARPAPDRRQGGVRIDGAVVSDKA
jgi:tyrosyl-tRNA synthetase